MTIAIIGCGSSGSAIGSQISNEISTDKIKLMDIDGEKSKRLSDDLSKKNKKTSFESYQLNANNPKKIVKLLNDVEVVINSASPFYNIPIMRACIKSKCNYIDLGSDPFKYEGLEGTSLDDQLPLNDSFSKNELIALTNAGASPGFSDLLCKHASETYNFDSLEKVSIYFSEIIESKVFISSWSPYILLLESLLPATVYLENEIVILPNSKRKKTVNLPPPFGSTQMTLFNGHPELRTIPQFINIPVSYVEVGGSLIFNEMNLDDMILESLRRKVTNKLDFEGDIIEGLSSSFEPTNSFVDLFNLGEIKEEMLFCYTDIVGKAGNDYFKYSASTKIDIKEIIKKTPFASATSYMVSIVPTLLTKKIIEGGIDQRGVLAPAALDIASEIIKLSEKFDIDLVENIN